jgi:hypothetical protein
MNLTPANLRERTLHRRAVEAAIWGMPAVNYVAHQIVTVGIDEVGHQPCLGGNVRRRRLGEKVDRERHDEFDHPGDTDTADIPPHLPRLIKRSSPAGGGHDDRVLQGVDERVRILALHISRYGVIERLLEGGRHELSVSD